MEENNPITYFAEVDRRNRRTPFGIKESDRTRHIYVIGKTGMGKSTMLENMAVQDIKNGNGLCFIDPHGTSVSKFLDYVPEERIEDVIYFAPFDVDNPISFNVMENVGSEKRHLVAQGLLSAFKKIWGEETFSDRMEHITNNTLLALLEYPDSTMLGMTKIFTDAKYRKKVVANITDPSVKAFWVEEFAGWDDRYRRDAYAAILNKVGQFTSNPLIRNIVGQKKSSFDFRKVLDEKKILLVNLSIGQVGEANADLLGSMITTKIYLAAMSRADVSPEELNKLPNFYLYIDEFQNLANDSFADILSQARKYKLNLTLAHQYIEQMPDVVRAAVFGNVGTMITFRVGATDAEVLEKEFAPYFTVDDLVNLGFAQVYLRLMIDGIGSTPFSARTLPPITKPQFSYKKEVIENSRALFTSSKEQTEKEIEDWLGSKNQQETKKEEPKNADLNFKVKLNKSEKDFIPVKNDARPQPQQSHAGNNSGATVSSSKQPVKNFPNKQKTKIPFDNKNQLKEALSSAMKNLEKGVKDRENKDEEEKLTQENGRNEKAIFDFRKSLEEKKIQKENFVEKQNPSLDKTVEENKKEINKEDLEKILYVEHPKEK